MFYWVCVCVCVEKEKFCRKVFLNKDKKKKMNEKRKIQQKYKFFKERYNCVEVRRILRIYTYLLVEMDKYEVLALEPMRLLVPIL